MVKTLLDILASSSNKVMYMLILAIPSVLLIDHIYTNPLNFSILLMIIYIATITSLLISLELAIQDEGSKVFDYMCLIKSENYVILYRTTSIFYISTALTLITSLLLNLVFIEHIYIPQQILYLILIIISNYFYTYFLQYVSLNIKFGIVRNVIIITVTALSILSLMTKSLSTYLMFVTVFGLFLAVTFMNRRLSDELKRKHDIESNYIAK